MKGSDNIMPQETQIVKLKLERTVESHAIARAILYGERRKAEEILRIADCNIFIPGTEYATADDIAEFYGVSRNYVKGVFGNRRISATVLPDCVQCKTIWRLCEEQGIRADEYIATLSPERKKRFGGGAISFYDARVILAFACLAFMNRKIIPNTNAERILEILKKTDYRDIAEKEIHGEPAEKPTALESMLVNPANVTGIMPVEMGGSVFVPVNALTEIIKAILPYLAK